MSKTVFKKGDILSETAYYVVQGSDGKGGIVTLDDFGNEITLSKDYVESDILVTGDYFDSEEDKTATELAEIFLANPYRVLTVCFIPQGKDKSKTQLAKDRAAWAEQVEKALMAKGRSAIEEFASKPVETKEKTDPRVMRGRWHGAQDNFGRVNMVDMEKPLPGAGANYDTRLRQVDTRTIQYLIVDKVKYTLKKK
jgi:hypothetical protein